MTINRHVLKCYHPPIGDDIILSGGIDGLNVVLKNEVSEEKAKEFLHDYCAGFLLSTMTFTPSLFVSVEYDSTGFTIKNDRGKNNKPVVIKDNDWTLQFGVATTRGGIELWHVSGQVSPLRIIDFNRKIILPDGTLEPIITTEGQAEGAKPSIATKP